MTRNKKSVLCLGPLTPGGEGKHWVEPKHDFPAPRQITNATSTGIYTGERWHTREGSEVHKTFKSRGFGC
jgi:hypothetical protein